jgi:uncharacterized protein (UPF0548 family)
MLFSKSKHLTKRIAKQRVTNRILSLGDDDMQNGIQFRMMPQGIERSNDQLKCEMKNHKNAL